MARAYGSRAQMALAFETTYGTAPASGYLQMPFASTSLGGEQPLVDSELLGYGRDPLAPIKDALTVDGDVVVPVDAVAIGYWLKALFGAPVTTGAGPYVHTYASGGLTLPSMSIEVGMPDLPHFPMYSGLVANTLRVQMQRAGLLQATVGLIGQGVATDTGTNAGTPTAITLQRFGHFHASIKRDTVALASIVSSEFTYSNNLDRVETIRNDGKIDGADPTIAALTGNLVARFADTTLLDQAVAGTACALELMWTISASVSLKMTANAVYLPRPRIAVDGPGGIQATFDWQGALAASAQMFTVVLTNGQASYA